LQVRTILCYSSVILKPFLSNREVNLTVMKKQKEIIVYAVSMIMKAALLAAAWAGKSRKRGLKSIAKMPIDDKDKEFLFLRDRIYQLETRIKIFQKQYQSPSGNPRYTPKERLFILWHMEYFQIPRRQVTKTFGIARSTLYRWLKRINDESNSTYHPWNKTPESLAALVWRISRDNIEWGRTRISNQLKLLNIFLAASTVRNILQRPKPKSDPRSKTCLKNNVTKNENGCRIPAWYPNHLWSVDLTEVYYWGLWKIYILVAIDYFSRRVVAVIPLEGPSTGFAINALEAAFSNSGKPKHIITDQGSVFTSAAFREFLGSYNVKIRYGAIGQNGSIAVTERIIQTLKYEWLKKVPVIRGYRHLTHLCKSFTEWYNNWRPHEYLGSATPAEVFHNKSVPFIPKTAKDIPSDLEIKRFVETRVTGYRIKQAA
jgi:transposase InsO family protein